MNIQFPTDFYLLSRSPCVLFDTLSSQPRDRAPAEHCSISPGLEELSRSSLPIYDRSNVFYSNNRARERTAVLFLSFLSFLSKHFFFFDLSSFFFLHPLVTLLASSASYHWSVIYKLIYSRQQNFLRSVGGLLDIFRFLTLST